MMRNVSDTIHQCQQERMEKEDYEMKKRVLAALLSTSLTAVALAGCTSGSAASTESHIFRS